jgi:hypothetical protein
VALAVKAALERGASGPVLAFDDARGDLLELDTRGTPEEMLARLDPAGSQPDPPETPRGRGRPRLGVVPREVTLLPRHWDWLNAQPGGASVTLRKLVEEARRKGEAQELRRLAQERTYRLMSALAGNEPGYEEALRAMYALDWNAYEAITLKWPSDIGDYLRRSARPAFETESTPKREE